MRASLCRGKNLSALFIVTVLLLAAVAYRIFRRQQELNSHRSERELKDSEAPSNPTPREEGAERSAGGASRTKVE
jgi:hypothetical protein